MSEPIEFGGRTARLSLPFLYPAQAQKEHVINESLAKLDCMVSPIIIGELAAPPSSPEDGAAYIVASGATGDWAGSDGAIAYWSANQWLFVEPPEGMRVFDAALTQFATYFDGWTRAAKPPAPNGGSVVDTEARAAITGIIDALTNTGVFSPS